MLNVRLNINGVDCPLTSRIPVSTNLAAADAFEPEKRNVAYTKSLIIPRTRQTDYVFELIWDVNIALNTFNPNLKTPFVYYVNERIALQGNLQLLEVSQHPTQGDFYRCSATGTTADLFQSIKNLYLTDIDWSDLDHALNYSNFNATPTLGSGYCYGYIDYGITGQGHAGFNWRVDKFKALIFAKEYVDRIFAAGGKTYTSTHLNSTYFKSFLVPNNKAGGYQFSPLQTVDLQFYAGKTSPSSSTAVSTSLAGSTVTYTTGSPGTVSNDDSTPPFNDPGGIYNTGTGIFTTTQITQNQVKAVINYTFRIIAANTVPSAVLFESSSSAVTFAIVRNGTIVQQFTHDIGVVSIPIVGTTAELTVTASVVYNSTTDPIGTTYQTNMPFNGQLIGTFKDSGGTPIASAGTSSLVIRVNAGTTFQNLLNAYDLPFGATVEMNDNIPRDITCLEFLSSIFRVNNLWIEQDKNDPNNYIIEPRDDGFIDYTNANALLWDKKHDTSKGVTTLPMGALDAKSYLFTFREDKDFLNQRYISKYRGDIYGQQKVNVTNDFVQPEKRVEVIFSPTPGAAYQTDIVAPRLYDLDDNGLQNPIETNIRLLYYGGVKNCDTHNLKISAGSNTPSSTNWDVNRNTYISVNHVDDPYNPTYDLNFGAPAELYWKLPAQMYTNGNWFNKYWKPFIDEVTNINSKIIRLWVLLDEFDISKFTFRKQVYLKGAYFLVNKIIDYDPQVRQSVLVELLKLKKGAAFALLQYDPYDPPNGTGRSIPTNPEYNQDGNYQNSNSLSVGVGVQNGAQVGLSTGNNLAIDRGVKSFDAIGVNDRVVGKEYEGMTMIRDNALTVSDRGVERIKISKAAAYTANFSVTKQVSYVDASGGNIDVTLPDPSELLDPVVVRIDNSGNVVTAIGPGGAVLIETNGVSVTSDVIPTRTTRRYTTDGTKYFY